jgi:hypothetical protein
MAFIKNGNPLKKMKVVALIEHYNVDQLTMMISSSVGPKKAKKLSKTRFVLGNDWAISQ